MRFAPLMLAAAFVVAAAFAPADASAGVVHGTVWLTRPSAKVAASPVRRAQPGVLDAVIYVDKVSDKVEKRITHHGWFAPKAPRIPRIVQSNRRFSPRVMAIATGSAIEFQNLDRVYHNAFSVSVAKRFDLGKYPPGRIDTVDFARAGVINLHCDIHPDEIGFVVVVPNHAFARPDSTGAYALPKLDAGHYLIRVWHPRYGEIRREVEMPKRGDLDLALEF